MNHAEFIRVTFDTRKRIRNRRSGFLQLGHDFPWLRKDSVASIRLFRLGAIDNDTWRAHGIECFARFEMRLLPQLAQQFPTLIVFCPEILPRLLDTGRAVGPRRFLAMQDNRSSGRILRIHGVFSQLASGRARFVDRHFDRIVCAV